jgi:hypothetical protein
MPWEVLANQEGRLRPDMMMLSALSGISKIRLLLVLFSSSKDILQNQVCEHLSVAVVVVVLFVPTSVVFNLGVSA